MWRPEAPVSLIFLSGEEVSTWDKSQDTLARHHFPEADEASQAEIIRTGEPNWLTLEELEFRVDTLPAMTESILRSSVKSSNAILSSYCVYSVTARGRLVFRRLGSERLRCALLKQVRISATQVSTGPREGIRQDVCNEIDGLPKDQR